MVNPRTPEVVVSDEVASSLVVFGDDGSPHAALAWHWLSAQRWPGWSLDVVSGADDVTGASVPDGAEPVLEEWTSPWSRPVADGTWDHVRFLHAPEDPRLLLDAYETADLMVVGAHEGPSGIRAQWSGSTADWLLQHPPAPLVLIRTERRATRVVACVDGSAHAWRALDTFLATPLAADTVVTALVVDDRRVDVGAVRAGVEERTTAGVPIEVEVARGRPTHVVADHLERTPPDLVLLGTRGLTGVRRLRLGSTASSIAHHCGCNCLLATAG